MNSIFQLRYRCVCFLLLIVISGASNIEASGGNEPDASAEWQRVFTDEEEFSIYMPVRMPVYIKENSRFGASGTAVKTERVIRGFDDGVMFVIKIYETANPKKILDDSFDEYQKRFKSKPQKVEMNGLKGVEISRNESSIFHAVKGFEGKSRAYIVEAASRNAQNPLIQQFFSTLKIGTMTTQSNLIALPAKNTAAAPAAASSPSKVYEKDEVTNPGYTLFLPIPRHPGSYQASIKVEFIATETGEIQNIKIPKNVPDDIAKYLTALMKYVVILPAEKDGKLVSENAAVVFNFKGAPRDVYLGQ